MRNESPTLAFLFLFISALLGYDVNAQSGRTCGTPPMDSATFVNKPRHGNNQFLLDLNDSIGYPASVPKSGGEDGFDTQTVYWIPVKAIVNGVDCRVSI